MPIFLLSIYFMGLPKKFQEENMKKYVCAVCGYEYDPAEHDNVPFEDLPEDWVCPVCGVSKSEFQEA